MLSDASKEADFAQSKVGTVLLSAAVIDDVSGLVMARYDSHSKKIPLASLISCLVSLKALVGSLNKISRLAG